MTNPLFILFIVKKIKKLNTHPQISQIKKIENIWKIASQNGLEIHSRYRHTVNDDRFLLKVEKIRWYSQF